MSTHVHGHIIIDDYLPCKIGQYANSEEWRGHLYGDSTASLLGKFLTAEREHWADDEYRPLINDLHIIWEKDAPSDNDNDIVIESEDEFYNLTPEQCKNLRFPAGSDGPIDLTIIPYNDRYKTTWHIVFHGSLRRCYGDGMGHIKNWWKTLQQFFEFKAGYIHAEWLDNIWEDKLF